MKAAAEEQVLEGLIVGKPRWRAKEVSTSISLGGHTYHIQFTASEKFEGREADFLLALAVLPAMATASRLKLPESVSCKLLSSLARIQDIYCSWDESFQRITVDVPKGSRESTITAHSKDNVGRNVACFFSGGVDSFYTALKHRDEISHLILMHGCFDTYPDDQSLRARNSRAAREAAKELGKSLIEVETNLRSFSNPLVWWGYYHGSTLFSVALLFQHLFRKVLVPASRSYAQLVPWGSHPLLDPLWGTELMEIVHEGGEATRIEKVAYISKHEVAMKCLHVCQRNSSRRRLKPNEGYNCGRCEKCLRTMLNLKAVGALELCETLPHDLSPADVERFRVKNRRDVVWAQENLKALERFGTDPALSRAVANLIDKNTDLGQTQMQLSRTQVQLSRTQVQLSRTQAKLEQSAAKLTAVRHRNKALLATRPYKLASAALRIPLVKTLLRQRKEEMK